MTSVSHFLFPPFRFDSVNEQLWRGVKIISLRSKTFAVLRYLLEHPGQLVTREQLLEAVWPKTYVSDSMPTICVRELRKALNDDAKTPRFVETVHGRGIDLSPRSLWLRQFQVSGSRFQVPPSPQAEAEACFRKAIEIARQQQAKSLELRAVMSLSRLWQQQGKKNQARRMLAEIYNWFTEGFDIADLREAKVLLEELSH